MKTDDLLTRQNLIIGTSIIIAALLVSGFFILRRPAHVSMDRYAPSDSLAFAEIDSLTDLVDGLTHTKAWRELGPVLGLSSQLSQVGFVADLIGRSGLGPDEAVVAGRAQFAIAVTGIDSNAGETNEGAYLHLKPRFVLIVETHSKPETAAKLVRDRTLIVVRRIFGDSVAEGSEDYYGTAMLTFKSPEPGRQLLAASMGSVILIANHVDAIKSCLDAVAGRTPSLATDSTLSNARGEVGKEPSIFGYLTASGIRKLVELSPLLFAHASSEPGISNSISDLIEHLSSQAIDGVCYSASFEAGGITEKYFTSLRPVVAEAISEPLKPPPGASFESLGFIPRDVESLALLNVERAGELPERVFKRLSPTLDIVAGVALREFVINLRKQYGLSSSDSIGDAVGSEIAIVNFGDEGPRAMLFAVNDAEKIKPFVARYLDRKGGAFATEQLDGIDIMRSSADEGRAAAFIERVLILATRDQIVRMIRTHAQHNGGDGDQRLREIIAKRSSNASIISYRPRPEAAGRFLLGISKLMRVTDGSPELLERDSARRAIEKLPPANSYTEFRDTGIFVESHSAVGNFGTLGSWISN
jgi:hypothetical protein